MDFPNPLEVDPTRDPAKYWLNGEQFGFFVVCSFFEIYSIGGGFHQCIGVNFAVRVITDILKIAYTMKNVQRAPGDSGRMHKITKVINEVEVSLLPLMTCLLPPSDFCV